MFPYDRELKGKQMKSSQKLNSVIGSVENGQLNIGGHGYLPRGWRIGWENFNASKAPILDRKSRIRGTLFRNRKGWLAIDNNQPKGWEWDLSKDVA